MATNDNITLTKGSNSVTIFWNKVDENLKNQLTIIPGVTSVDNQTSAPNPSQVADLQRSTYTYKVNGFITKSESPAESAKTIKDRLRVIFEGSRTAGGPIVMTYEDESINVFFEDLVISKEANDNTVDNYSGYDAKEYTVSLVLVKGEQA